MAAYSTDLILLAIVIKLMSFLYQTLRFDFDNTIFQIKLTELLLCINSTIDCIAITKRDQLRPTCLAWRTIQASGIAVNSFVLHLRLAIRSFQVSLLVLRSWKPLSDLSHASRHSDRFHEVLLIGNQ